MIKNIKASIDNTSSYHIQYRCEVMMMNEDMTVEEIDDLLIIEELNEFFECEGEW